jgi:hypothetical protein
MRNRKSFPQLLRAINSYDGLVYGLALYYGVCLLIAFGIGAVVHWITGWRGPVWMEPVAAGVVVVLIMVALARSGPSGPE